MPAARRRPNLARDAPRATLDRLRVATRRTVASRPVRRAALQRLAAATVVVALTTHVGLTLERARALREHWGRTEEVVVATHDLPAGIEASADDLEVQRRPVDHVPAGALRSMPGDPLTVTAHVASGEPVLAIRVGDGGVTSSLVPHGYAVVALETGGPLPELSPGDRVDVLAPPADLGPATRVAQDAVVIEPPHDSDDTGIPPSSLTVAVPEHDVASTAAAVLVGPVTVAMRPA